MRHFVLCILCAIALCIATTVCAQVSFWSVGPKLGYAWGIDPGFTAGFEASYFPQQPGSLLLITGFTADLTWWGPKKVGLHFGYEVLPLLIFGFDVGPTILLDPKGLHMAISTIVFLGAYF